MHSACSTAPTACCSPATRSIRLPLYAQLPGSNATAYAESAARLATMTEALDHLLPGHNVPLVDAVYLQRMHDAFQAIASETTPFEAEGEHRRYPFDGFSIIVPTH